MTSLLILICVWVNSRTVELAVGRVRVSKWVELPLFYSCVHLICGVIKSYIMDDCVV